MNSRFAVIVIVLALGFGALFITGKKNNQDATQSNNQTAQPTKHTYGEGAKKVELVEYGDFECPACAAYYPIIKEVKEKYKADITFRFAHFPLTQIHVNAMAAHRAAEAAAKQGKFWEMHDLIYETRGSWSSSPNASGSFESYAGQLGLNLDQFKTDVASADINARIQADIKEGTSKNVTGTPAFFLNGEKIANAPQDVEGWSKLIDQAIASQK